MKHVSGGGGRSVGCGASDGGRMRNERTKVDVGTVHMLLVGQNAAETGAKPAIKQVAAAERRVAVDEELQIDLRA